MAPRYVLVAPFAHDLTPLSQGPVECGPGTRAADEHAVREAQTYKNAIILLTATRAGKQYGSVLMWPLMERHIDSLHPVCPVVHECARWFNTLGEILGIIKYIKRMRRRGVEFEEVILAVKDWHKPRTLWLAKVAFLLCRISDIPVRAVTHESPPGAQPTQMERRLEFFKFLRQLFLLPFWAWQEKLL